VSPLLPRQPSLFVRTRRILAWSVTLLLGMALVGLTGERIAHGETFQVREVRFVGAERASEVQLRHLADIQNGTHLFHADLDRAVQGIQDHPWIRKATARRRFPGAIEIHVREHQPKMLLALEQMWFVDDNGAVFKQADTGSLDYPLLTGIGSVLATEHPHLARAVIDGAIDLLKAVEADNALVTADLSEINFDSNTGYALVLRSGTHVIVGFSDPTLALDRLTQMRSIGLDLAIPQRIDLAVDTVAIATPLPN